jgi:iron complex outermembrane receptor protein
MKKQVRKRQAYRFKRFVRKAYAAFNSMHRVVSIGVVSGCMLTFVHAKATTQSQDSISQKPIPERELELDEVVVTGSKAALTMNQTAKIVTVITREEIARQPVQSVQDLLKNIVGLDVRQRGAQGVLAGISVRGGTFEQTAILLNGANITNPQTAHYSLDIPVNLSDIERIEIIQGPTSLLYGAGAFSGGINIVTKKDSETGVYMNLEGGMYEFFGVETRGAIEKKSSNHSLSARYNSSDGYIANSDFKIFNALWQSNFKVDDSKLDFLFGLNDKEYGANTFYSPAYANQFDDTWSLFATISGKTGQNVQFSPQMYWKRHYDEFHLFRPNTANIPEWYTQPNFHRSDVFGFSLNSQYKWAGGVSNFGGELRNEGIYSSVLGKPLEQAIGNYLYSDNRTNISYFLEHSYLHNKFTASVGLLANYNSAFKDDFDFFPNINLSYWINHFWKVFASWNNAIRMPTFTDLYYKGATHKGNSDVQPEKSEAFELGLRYTNHTINTYFTGFYMKGKNLIDWVKENPEDLWESRNLTNLDKIGFEFNTSIAFKASRLNVGYMYMNQDKNAGDLISNYVLDYLRHKLTVGLHQPMYKNLSIDCQFRWQDRQGTYTHYENSKPASERAYQPFGLLDVKLNWEKNDLKIYTSINNVFDTYYFDLGNLPQPGFWLIGGVSWILK